jgi:hypothetical protein
MAATFTLATDGHAGRQPFAPNIIMAMDVALDAAYPGGGYDFDPAAELQRLGNYDKAPNVLSVLGESKGDFMAEFDRDNNKLIVRLISTGAEAAGDLSVTPGSLRLMVFAQ